MSANLKLPKTLYVRMTDEGDDGVYPLAYESIEEAIDEDGPTVVGSYTLASRDTYRKAAERVKA